MHPRAENDGDFHVTVNVHPPFKQLLNGKNASGQHGFLVVEPVCDNPVTQADTLKEGSCNGFSQHVFHAADGEQARQDNGSLRHRYGAWLE